MTDVLYKIDSSSSDFDAQLQVFELLFQKRIPVPESEF